MAIEFRCPQCQTLLRTPDETKGRQAVCPQCSKEMKVPYISAPSKRHPPAPEYEPPPASVPPSTPAEQMAITSFVLGILSLCFSCCCLIGMPMAIIGLVLGIKGLESRHRGLAIAGIVLSAIGILANLGVTTLKLLIDGGVLQGP